MQISFGSSLGDEEELHAQAGQCETFGFKMTDQGPKCGNWSGCDVGELSGTRCRDQREDLWEALGLMRQRE